MDSMQHDTSDVARLDDYFAKKRDTEVALAAEAARAEHEVKVGGLRNERIRQTGIAALLGGAGLGLALFGASFMIAAHHERVVIRDVPGPERIVKVPEYVTPKERDFLDRPEYKSAEYKGRLVADADGYIRFDTGKYFHPTKPNAAGLLDLDSGAMYDTTPYLGNLAYCNAIPGSEVRTVSHTPLMDCQVIHKDVVISLDTTLKQKPSPHAANGSPTRSAESMINVYVDADGYPIEAILDTGCSFPLAIPEYLAEALTVNGHAIRGSKTKAALADGSMADVDTIRINQITVDGRTLHDVEAVVSQNTGASILLGWGALNRLGKFKIENGQIVFTSEQPT
jgi:Aspartyl protease